MEAQIALDQEQQPMNTCVPLHVEVQTTLDKEQTNKVCTHALRAPPPLACPSSLVMITEATSTLSLKALACTETQTAVFLIFVISSK